MQLLTIENSSSLCGENLCNCNQNIGDNGKLVPFVVDKVYNVDITEQKPSLRIQTIQKKIDCLRESNHLLITQIRKVCDTNYIPSNSDQEYLNQLFEADQLHVKDLSDSLASGKIAIDSRMQEAYKDGEYRDCDKCKNLFHLHIKPGRETRYIMAESPLNVPTHGIYKDRDLQQKNLHNSQQCSSHEIIKGSSSLKFEECHKHDLSEMEKELRRMKQRLERLNQQRENKCNKNLDLSDEDSLQCTIENTYGIPVEEDLTITYKEKVALEKFRQLVREHLKDDYMQQDIYLIRWIRAANLDLKLAEQKLLDNLKWRQENDIDNLLNEDFSDFEIDYPYTTDTYDKTGRPMIAFTFGDWDIRKAVLAGQARRFTRYLDRAFEDVSKQIRDKQARGENVTQAQFLINLENFSVTQQGCIQCLPAIFTYFQHQV
ncbi:unnamed protein product [Orchesella dallaii]|uniref:CRAL/TRIO N-terminal domain-containing protein n=1 Tax=Orchesella dallaii TaxID=48710 RepID=A0ABP1QYZ6_9HEXA